MMQSGARRFACTSCGRCCNRGPEMELSEATALAGTFVTSLLFRVHSLPASDRSGWAKQWWDKSGSRIPIRPALEEARRHLGHFASRKRADKLRDRQLFLDISAIVDDDGEGRCPALIGNLCGIYETRPITCRTVPMHYSRAPSTLQNGLDQFTSTSGYECDTGPAAPIILDGNRVVDDAIGTSRDQAIATAKADRTWKDRIVAFIDDGDRAARVGLPSFEAILAHSDSGYATMLPMIVAWRVAAIEGIISPEQFEEVCRQQAALIKGRIARNVRGTVSGELLGALAAYQAESSKVPAR